VSVALIIQHAMLISSIIVSNMVCLVPQYFSTLYHKRHNFREKSYEIQTVCFELLHNSCLKHSHFNKNPTRYCHKSA